MPPLSAIAICPFRARPQLVRGFRAIQPHYPQPKDWMSANATICWLVTHAAPPAWRVIKLQPLLPIQRPCNVISTRPSLATLHNAKPRTAWFQAYGRQIPALILRVMEPNMETPALHNAQLAMQVNLRSFNATMASSLGHLPHALVWCVHSKGSS